MGHLSNPEPKRTIVRDVETARRVKAEEIAAARWKKETGGIVVQGVGIDTSRESQGLISGAALQAVVDPKYVCRWKTSVGFIELDATMIMAIGTAVRQHVQSCFDREAELLERVNDPKATLEEVLAVRW